MQKKTEKKALSWEYNIFNKSFFISLTFPLLHEYIWAPILEFWPTNISKLQEDFIKKKKKSMSSQFSFLRAGYQ